MLAGLPLTQFVACVACSRPVYLLSKSLTTLYPALNLYECILAASFNHQCRGETSSIKVPVLRADHCVLWRTRTLRLPPTGFVPAGRDRDSRPFKQITLELLFRALLVCVINNRFGQSYCNGYLVHVTRQRHDWSLLSRLLWKFTCIYFPTTKDSTCLSL